MGKVLKEKKKHFGIHFSYSKYDPDGLLKFAWVFLTSEKRLIGTFQMVFDFKKLIHFLNFERGGELVSSSELFQGKFKEIFLTTFSKIERITCPIFL